MQISRSRPLINSSSRLLVIGDNIHGIPGMQQTSPDFDLRVPRASAILSELVWGVRVSASSLLPTHTHTLASLTKCFVYTYTINTNRTQNFLL
jgi:hypothetical protein